MYGMWQKSINHCRPESNFSIDQQDFILKESWQFDCNFIDVMAALELTELK